MWCLEELIEASPETTDYAKVAKVISRDLDESKCKRAICEDAYRVIYNGHLQPDACIEMMPNPIWSIDETNTIAKKLGYAHEPYEFWLVMNMKYKCLHDPLKESSITLEPTTYGRIANHCITFEHCDLIDMYFDAIW